METAMFVVSLMGAIATVVSCIITVKAKNESKSILKNIKEINNGVQYSENRSRDIDVSNTGKNEGVMAGSINGGVNNGKK